jgi:hypothetical protein
MEPTKLAINRKIERDKGNREMSEVGRQFKEVFEKFYDPVERDKRKILATRKKRAENITKDLGL